MTGLPSKITRALELNAQGLSVYQIAERLGSSENSIRVMLSREAKRASEMKINFNLPLKAYRRLRLESEWRQFKSPEHLIVHILQILDDDNLYEAMIGDDNA
jgi:orotate phosphoribosyltransferase-like protein